MHALRVNPNNTPIACSTSAPVRVVDRYPVFEGEGAVTLEQLFVVSVILYLGSIKNGIITRGDIDLRGD